MLEGSDFSIAIDLARLAHQKQVRKYTNEPYIVHPFAVAGLVASISNNESMIIAALLHDVVEDSPLGVESIHKVLGSYIAKLVLEVTDVSKLTDGNRKTRKKIDFNHTVTISPEAKTIKLADLIDNVKTITYYDPGFAKVYMVEKRELLTVLKEGDSTLYTMAKTIVEAYFVSQINYQER